MNEIELNIEKLVHGGRGMGYFEDKPVFVWNALPGETVKLQVTKKKKNYLEGIVTEVIKASPDRIKEKEDHFLSCSPWQIMTFDQENFWKEEITKETFQKLAGIKLDEIKIISEDLQYSYRNKMEYSFYIDEEDKLNLAFFKRGSKGLYPIDKCELAKEKINVSALRILEHLKKHKVNRWDLKTLILRENQKGEVLAALFVKKEDFKIPDLELGDLYSSSEVERSREVPQSNELSTRSSNNSLLGFKIYYSNPKSPASVPTELISSSGEEFLEEKILDKKFRYGVLSFFQVNLPLYEKVLTEMKGYFAEEDLVDFYSGTGSIGICLSDNAKSGILVESDAESGSFAKENIELNNLKNFETHIEPAEKMLEEIKKEKTIIFDPPRAGLHPKVTEKLLEVVPPKIIYLSCDIATQARDIGLLKDKYEIQFHKIYNFFPRTPHIESLIVLQKK